MNWKVLHTGETNALTVRDRLKEKDVETIVPTKVETRIRRGRKVRVERAIVEGYAFARKALRVRGVRDVLKTADGKHATVSDDEVAKISRPPPPEVSNGLRTGSRVMIVKGPFATFKGKVQHVRKGKARIAIKIFGGSSNLELPTEWLEVIEGKA
jgi:transcription antitermination factor NusG